MYTILLAVLTVVASLIQIYVFVSDRCNQWVHSIYESGYKAGYHAGYRDGYDDTSPG